MTSYEVQRKPGQSVVLIDRAGRRTTITLAGMQVIGDRITLRIHGPAVDHVVLEGGPGEPGALPWSVTLSSES